MCCTVLDVCAVLDQTSNTPGLSTSEMDTNYSTVMSITVMLTPPTYCAPPTHLPCPPCKWWSCVPRTLCCLVKGMCPLVVGGGGMDPAWRRTHSGLPDTGVVGEGEDKGELVIITHLFLHKHLLTYLNKKTTLM